MQKKIVLFIPILLVLLAFPSHAFATQYIPYMGTSLPSHPKICVYDNVEGSKYFANVTAGVKEWQDKLNWITHSKNWNMTVSLVDNKEISTCSVWFHFTIERSDLIDIGKYNGEANLGSIQGVTLCGYQDAGANEDTKCEIRFYVLNVNKDHLPQVIRHEFGHALGLGHRVGDTAQDYMRAFLSDDLMFPFTKPFAHLTNEDALAVVKLYGVHGFHFVLNYPDAYIISYHTKVKEYCNNVNGTICYKNV